jgi:Asp-tRNA(Asn)/Glu-tRNA(Gln) amidotransferase B subunit
LPPKASLLTAADEAARLLSGNRVEVKNMNSVRTPTRFAVFAPKRHASPSPSP